VEREDINKAWEYYKHVDNLYTGRTNFFLIAESMLLLAFVSIFAVDPLKFKFSNIIKGGIAALGLIYTISWQYLNLRLEKRMNYLTKEYLKKDKVYKEYIESAKGIESKIILSYILPLFTILLWSCFLGLVLPLSALREKILTIMVVFLTSCLILFIFSSFKNDY